MSNYQKFARSLCFGCLPLLLASTGVAAYQIVELQSQCAWSSPSSTLLQSDHLCPLSIDEDAKTQPTNWAPWTHRPYCGGSKYCVFTQANQSISVITTAETAVGKGSDFEAMIASRTTESPLGYSRKDPPWEVMDIQAKGKGVIARRHIARGELIMLDFASLLVDSQLAESVSKEKRQDLVTRAVGQLPEPDKILSLSQSLGTGSTAVEAVLRTNSFDIRFGGVEYAALFPRVSVSSDIHQSIPPDSACSETTNTLTENKSCM